MDDKVLCDQYKCTYFVDSTQSEIVCALNIDQVYDSWFCTATRFKRGQEDNSSHYTELLLLIFYIKM